MDACHTLITQLDLVCYIGFWDLIVAKYVFVYVKVQFHNLTGPEVTKDSEPSSSTEYLPVQVRTVHISSPILAARSPFFYKVSFFK